MASFRLTVDAPGLETLGNEAFRLPPGIDNPLMQWNQAYGYVGMTTQRPTVGVTALWRGNVWKHYSPNYIQWGKRPSGARLTLSSLQMQDTGRMFQDFFLGDPLLLEANTVLIKSTPLKYAPYQDKLRPFVWGDQIQAEEEERLEKAYLLYLDGVLK